MFKILNFKFKKKCLQIYGNKTALQHFNIILNSMCDLENTLYVHTKCIPYYKY